ncbi:MAG: BatA domain-containing protein [Bacteroidia bacterium]|nr:BatA domain-containing protein [Bacteroidia bacterium]
MQFKHPEILYALLLLLIPIIVHLFQLRRFQSIEFTNVKYLKRVAMQTRKSSVIKKWLTLITRLLLLAALILAFSQPYLANKKALNQALELVIYLDNSFSMNANGTNGKLLKRAAQNLITEIPEQQKFSLFTNTSIYNSVTINDIKSELIELDYSATRLDYKAVLLKGKQLFSKDKSTLKQFVFVSDFQKNQGDLTNYNDSNYTLNLVKLIPENTSNISIDSLYLNNNDLHVKLNSQLNTLENLSVSLFDNDNLIAKSAVTENNNNIVFTLPISIINGKVVIEDSGLIYDNSMFFNINEASKIKVLTINDAEDNYLKSIFSEDEFTYTSKSVNQLNFSTISEYNLVVLNELDNLSSALIVSLNSFINNGGSLLVIPSNEISLNSYNQLVNRYNINFNDKIKLARSVTTINFDHPIYNNVFDKNVTNFQYPKVNNFYTVSSAQEPVLKLEDTNVFLTCNQNVFVFASALNTINSNITNSPLIVPTLYNIGKQSLKHPKLYYNIGKENKIDVDITLPSDAILKINNATGSFIPLQKTYSNKVTITTTEQPAKAGTYSIQYNDQSLKNISFNYTRKESVLEYYSTEELKDFNLSTSIPTLFNTIKNDTNVNELWKWFVIFAMVFLVLELLILKYYK